MDRHELLHRLGHLRRAQVGDQRAPHKPLLLLWLFGRFANTGGTAVSYEEAETPVSRLINDFGPPVRSSAAAAQRAAMPFVHLERDLWDLRDSVGVALDEHVPERRQRLLDCGARGRLRPEVEALLAEPGTLAHAGRLLLDLHFTPALAEMIADAVGLDVADLDVAAVAPAVVRRLRRAGFAEEVLQAYAYACAMCGFDGQLGRNPVGIEAAHVRWHSQGGPDEVDNALSLCALHHALFDLGVVGIADDLTVRVSGLYVARGDAGRLVFTLAGREIAPPRPGRPHVAAAHIDWHARQVFKEASAAA